MVVQTQSAKLGIATGKNLAELCRETLLAARPRSASGCRPRWWRWRATSPRWSAPRSGSTCSSASRCFPAGADRRRRRLRDPRPPADGLPPARGGDHGPGRRRRRLLRVRARSTPTPTAAKSRSHLFLPGFSGTESILLATGIIGATVMPHVIYLHSALTQRRIVGRDDDGEAADPALREGRRGDRDVDRRAWSTSR